MRNPIRCAGVVLFLMTLAASLGCGGGSDGPAPAAPCAAPTESLTGAWLVNETAISPSPDCSGLDVYTLTGTQTPGSSAVTVIDSIGRNYSGTMCGNVVTASVPFSYAEDGGMTTVTQLIFTVTGDSLSGSSNWSWSDGIDSCAGTSTFTATR